MQSATLERYDYASGLILIKKHRANASYALQCSHYNSLNLEKAHETNPSQRWCYLETL